MVHCLGALSFRHLMIFVPWRKRSPVKWSYVTSSTIFGATGSHSPLLSVLQRLGPPGAFPVKPGGLRKASNFLVKARLSAVLKAEVNPTCCNKPLSSYRPSKSDPINFDPLA